MFVRYVVFQQVAYFCEQYFFFRLHWNGRLVLFVLYSFLFGESVYQLYNQKHAKGYYCEINYCLYEVAIIYGSRSRCFAVCS